MSQENVEIVGRILAEWATGDFGAAVGDFDPHIVLVVRPSFPEHGVFLGPDGVRDYMRRFLAQWERYTIQGKDVNAVGDTVLARVVQCGSGKASGVESEMPSFVLFTFRGARIVRMEFVLDEQEALEAAGLAERARSEENVEVVRRVYAEWERGNMNAGVELFHSEIVFESFMPDANERIVANGPGEVETFMREFLAQWRDYRLTGDEFRQVGRDKVVVAGRQAAIGRQSGAAVEGPTCSVWTFRGGKVVHLLFDPDHRKALQAAGLKE